MINKTVYSSESQSIEPQSVEIQPNTRDHRGHIVPDEIYQLVETTQSGWALICPDNAVCHYVDPESIHEAHQRCFL